MIVRCVLHYLWNCKLQATNALESSPYYTAAFGEQYFSKSSLLLELKNIQMLCFSVKMKWGKKLLQYISDKNTE